MASEPEEKLRDWSFADAWKGLNKPVFLISIVLIIGGAAFAAYWGSVHGADAFETLNTTITDGVGWWYVLICTIFVFFAFWVGLSKVGNVRLGRDDEKPEFKLGSWFAMLFAAGMGIGLVFWGVAEPLNHFSAPPEISGELGTDANGDTITATDAQLMGAAMGQTFFHWGLHAWAIYVVVGLGLAYMTFRRGRPLSIRWLLEPIFGRKLIESWVGHVIDIVAVVGTIFGIVTSLGIGAQQILGGLGFMGWVEDTNNGLVMTAVIGVIMLIATYSVVSGVNKGLKWLSNINMITAAILALFVLIAGPTLFLLQQMVANTGEYLQALPQLLFETSASYVGGDDGAWTADWTIYYWGWWMSWAPFVGMFIARISRGRTIREFVLGVLLAPTLVGMIWFSIFGSSGLYYQIRDGVMIGEDGVDQVASLFILLEQLPIASITAVVAILVITIFFITSGDSGSLVTDVLAYGGRPDTPRLTRVFWTVMIALVTIALMATSEDADAALRVLQVTAIASAAPLSIVYALAMIAQIRLYSFEGRTQSRYVRVRQHPSKAALVETARSEVGSDEGPAVQKSILGMLGTQAKALRGSFGSASATYSGLPYSTVDQALNAQERENTDVVMAIQDLPASATTVNSASGLLSWDQSQGYQDPLGDEEFSTEEFSQSYEGWSLEAEEVFEEALSTGPVDVIQDPADQDTESGKNPESGDNPTS